MSTVHRIGRINCQLRARQAEPWAGRLANLINDRAARSWEALFDRYDRSDMVWRIDRLELDLGQLDATETDQGILRALTQAMDEALQRCVVAANDATAQSSPQEVDRWSWLAEQLEAFLVTGRWAANNWAAQPRAAWDMLAEHRPDRLWMVWRGAWGKAGKPAAQRLVWHFGANVIGPWLGGSHQLSWPKTSYTQAFWRKLVADEQAADAAWRTWLVGVAASAGGDNRLALPEVWRELGTWLREDASGSADAGKEKTNLPTWLKETLKQAGHSVDLPNAGPRHQYKDKALATAAEMEHVLAPQAGVVVLHPFIQIYFAELGWLAPNQQSFDSEASQQLAMQALHWLATAEEELGEHQAVTYKLLVGWPLEKPLWGQAKLPVAALEQGEQLLQAVVRHWAALGNSSPAGLREAFLQRPGWCRRDDMGWQLAVERRSLDVLLDRLPWGIGVVKLPWMAAPLVVTW